MFGPMLLLRLRRLLPLPPLWLLLPRLLLPLLLWLPRLWRLPRDLLLLLLRSRWPQLLLLLLCSAHTCTPRAREGTPILEV